MANQLIQSRRPRKMIHRCYSKDEICKRARSGEEEVGIVHEPSTVGRDPMLGLACGGLEVDQEFRRRMDLRSWGNDAILPRKLPGPATLSWDDIA